MQDEKMVELIKKDFCTGCSVCAAACPRNCISMLPDELGFLYPFRSDQCIGCGLCYRMCPANPEKEDTFDDSFVQIAYAAVTKDKKAWRRSSSGGAFYELCRAWDNGNTFFCGAMWDGLKVKHVCGESLSDAIKFSKSKYISSEIGDVYHQIKNYLDEGKNGIFSGTPCQVSGLKAYLKKDYPGLLTIDLICHGVGSPAVFSECIRSLEKQFQKKIMGFGFREKSNAHSEDHIDSIIFNTGEKQLVVNDPFIELFKKQYCLRNTCGPNCKYRSKQRMGDLTIGDFKSLPAVFPELTGDKRNYSAIIVNSTRGEKIIFEISKKMELHECKIEEIEKYNPGFCRHTLLPNDRDAFIAEFEKSAESAIEKWTRKARVYKRGVRGSIYDELPTNVRKWIKKRW